MDTILETPEKWISVKEYADLEGVTVQAVYYRIKKRNLKSKMIGTFTLVSPE